MIAFMLILTVKKYIIGLHTKSIAANYHHKYKSSQFFGQICT